MVALLKESEERGREEKGEFCSVEFELMVKTNVNERRKADNWMVQEITGNPEECHPGDGLAGAEH